MKRLVLCIAAALLASPALAQVSYPPTPGTSVDLAPLQAKIDAAAAAAATAKAKADAAAADAATAASTAAAAQATATANAAAAADVAAAKTKADNAAAAAATAQTTATNAASTASTASTTATTAASTAATAQTTATAAAAAAAAACQPMAIVPPVEVIGGTTGTGQNCRLVNAANNRISRTGLFTVGAGGAVLCSGSTTCTWKDSVGAAAPLPTGAASYPVFFTVIGTTAAPGVKCKVTSSTNTGFTGAQCVQSVASISLLGAAIEVAATSGTQVFILSLPATQASQ